MNFLNENIHYVFRSDSYLFFVSRIVGVFVLNIAGLPGALIGGRSTSKREAKYVVGVILSAIGHIYVYLAFMIYLILWTKYRIDCDGFAKYLTWFVCAVACVGSIQKIYQDAKLEEKETNSGFQNPQILSLLITEVISFFGFFLFVFFPEFIHPLWSWVSKIGFPF